jgi:hypothetical protein
VNRYEQMFSSRHNLPNTTNQTTVPAAKKKKVPDLFSRQNSHLGAALVEIVAECFAVVTCFEKKPDISFK